MQTELLATAASARSDLLDGIDDAALQTTQATLRHLLANATSLRNRSQGLEK